MTNVRVKIGVVAIALPMLVMDGSALARKRTKSEPEPTPVLQPEPTPIPRLESLFDGVLPLSVSALPSGLANLSAQGCNGCHYESHDTWSSSSHSKSASNERFLHAVQRAGTPACLACHLPLATQQPQVTAYQQGDVNHPSSIPNSSFDATAYGEGVTCAACHVREGLVVTSRPVDNAPHPTIWSPQLSTSEACGSCHQLTWDGADQPLYDTYGEWERSGYAKANIQCQDCHMRSGASNVGTASHQVELPANRAVSVLTDISSLNMVRGGEPITVSVTVQNTGAGHSFPTGSPFKGAELSVFLESDSSNTDKTIRTQAFRTEFSREIAQAPPWTTHGDSRLLAGEQETFSSTHRLEQDAIAAEWAVRVVLQKTVNGVTIDEPIYDQRFPLFVD